MENELNILAHRSGFNVALRHFKLVNRYVSEISEGANLADLINQSLEEGKLQRFQIRSILNALLIEKFNYLSCSHNLVENIEDSENITDTVGKWNNIQLVVAYHNPQTGLAVINPKNKAQIDAIMPMTRDELIVIYAGPVKEELDQKTLLAAMEDFIKVLYGEKIKPKKGYIIEVEEKKLTQQQAQAAPVRRRVTPRYSVQVTNELFHNGNVEAWKKIIESYKYKYPDLDVMIWYDNERINDINALFKWGKVKHGELIFFSIAGENIKDVSKLQRYLFEGASPRFEVFLRGGIGQVLDLF